MCIHKPESVVNNEAPPNPESMAFHVRLGFRFLHSRPSRHGKIVAMLERSL